MMLKAMPESTRSPNTYSPVVLVLAAGKGRRFVQSGGHGSKLQAPLHGRTVLGHVLAAVQASGLPCHVVDAMPAASGMADSIAAGVRATPGASAWLVLPGDLPLLQASTLVYLHRQLQAAPPGICCVVPRFGGQRGHPVVFGAACFDALSQITGEEGAASVVQALRVEQRVWDVPVDDPGAVNDVDTVDDLQRLAHLLVPTHAQATAMD